MPGQEVALRDYERRDRDRVINVLVMAFHDDPAFLHLFPSARGRRRALRWLQSTAIETATSYGGNVLLSGDGSGICVWYPEGAFPPPRRAFLALIGGVVHLPPSSISRSLRALYLLQSKHPAAPPHIYVEVLGVDPDSQRGGHGTALLGRVCEIADTQGIAVYLETSKETNIGYYARFGFAVIETTGVRGGPPYWLMLREAKET